MTELFVVSDLHLGAVEERERERYSGAFGRFAEHLALRDQPGRLVLLGDTFDFLHVGDVVDPSPAVAVDKLRRLADAHPAVVDALRSLLARGWQLDLVAGNHDPEIVLPDVQDALLALLPGVAVWPWLLHIPGLVHAEHGHQHHDVNAMLEPLGPAHGRPVRLPLASYLSDPLCLARVATARRRWRGHDVAVRDHATALSLPADVALALDRLAARSVLRMAARLVAKSVGHPSASDYMVRAARRVHEVRAAAGVAVPFYVFGHTHLAASVRLAPGATYLNCGTWTPYLPAETRRPWLTAVHVTEAVGEVVRWDDERQELVPAIQPDQCG